MASLPTRLIAEERDTRIARALADWLRISKTGGGQQGRSSMPRFWNERHGYWAYFGRANANTSLGWRYWNAFGIRPDDPTSSMAVEINPPQFGIAAGTQGLFARDAIGKRWILHGGRLHIGHERINSDRFAELSGFHRVRVTFSNESERDYFLVAPLDQDSEALHQALRLFIATCARIRTQLLLGTHEAELEDRANIGEGQSSDEKRGDYVIPARSAVIATRLHADMWHALTEALHRLKIDYTNKRVGRWGPDLRTRGKKPILFEIKTDTTARAIYEALGQLLLYEKLLGEDHRKVLVVPGKVSTTFASLLESLGIAVMVARKEGHAYEFGKTLNDLTR